jgi:predicted secreted protein
MKPNKSVTLSLNENQRFEDRWKFTNSSGLEINNYFFEWTDYNGTPTNLIGIRGIHSWNITAVQTGRQTINGKFYAQRFNVTIFVE